MQDVILRQSPADQQHYRATGVWPDETFADVLRARTAAHPDREAVTDGKARLTYRQLEDAIIRVADLLARSGIRPGDIVAVQLPNWIEFIPAYFAIERIGAIGVPVSIEFRAREVDYVLRTTGARDIITCAEYKKFDHGKGQVVDAAMVDGSASLMGLIYGIHAAGYWQDRRGVNRLDGGAPFYNVYETADGRHVSIGANEERFYANAVRLLGLEDAGLPDQHDQSGWPLMREKFAQAFKTRTRDEWVALAAGKEACITPVLSLSEAPQAPHLRARATFVEVEGVTQPAPAPRFSRTPGAIQRPPARPGQHSDEILGDWGFSAAEIDGLRRAAAVG